MNQEISQLKAKVSELEASILELKNMLSISGMPYDLKEIIRNEVIKAEDLVTPTSTVKNILAVPYSLTMAVIPTGVLILKWRGKEYKLLYV
jgi:hypothetical protein